MPEKTSSRRRGIVYAVLLAISLLLLGASGTAPMAELRRGVNFALSPVQAFLAGTTRSVTSVFTALAEIERLRRDNEDLQTRVQRLETENRLLQGARRENEELTALLGLRSTLDYETVAAEVVSRQASDLERAVALDHGSDDGIRVGDAVLGEGGALIGQVVEVAPNSAAVMLLNDTRSVVIGLVETSRATGEVQGRLAEPLAMTKIPSTETVAIDQLVVTAGIDLGEGARSPFPRGILIGRIVDVENDPNAVVQTARIEPAAALDKLEYVLVVTDFEPPGPMPSAAPSGPGATGAPGPSAPGASAPGTSATPVTAP
jgi:rod shape-determining protein MreC